MGDGPVQITFAGSGDAFGSGGRLQACLHIRRESAPPVLLDCGATALVGLKRLGLEPNDVDAIFISHLHGDHFGGLPFLILDGQFRRRTQPLVVAGPAGLQQRLTDAMEVLFPGSSTIRRKFDVEVVELLPGKPDSIRGIDVSCWEVEHPSGAPPLALRLEVDGGVLAYTGDTAWTGAIVHAAAGARLLIAESYHPEKEIPYHLNHATLLAHRNELGCERVIVAHMSADMLARLDEPGFEAGFEAGFEVARDGLIVSL